MENSMEGPQKTKNGIIIGSGGATPGHMSGQNCNGKRHAHSSTIHNSQLAAVTTT